MDKQTNAAKTRIKRQAAIIQCLKARLTAAEQSEAAAIKMMVKAMEATKLNIPNPINTLPSD